MVADVRGYSWADDRLAVFDRAQLLLPRKG